VDADVLTLSDRLDLDPAARGLWGALRPHLAGAFEGEDGGFLTALAAAARSAALSGSVPVAALLDAYNEGSCQLCRLLDAAPGEDAAAAGLRLRALEKAALVHVATGYCEGLGETVGALRRAAEEVSPLDPETGVLKPSETMARLLLEAERCRRMDAPLGLVGLAVAGPGPGARTGRPQGVREDARLLTGRLRKYDSVGLTSRGDFVVIIPDVSRRGLVSAAERLCGEVGRRRGREPAPDLACTFFHYDDVDVDAVAMLAALERGLDEAKCARRRAAS
jgi:hypothetical protein